MAEHRARPSPLCHVDTRGCRTARRGRRRATLIPPHHYLGPAAHHARGEPSAETLWGWWAAQLHRRIRKSDSNSSRAEQERGRALRFAMGPAGMMQASGRSLARAPRATLQARATPALCVSNRGPVTVINIIIEIIICLLCYWHESTGRFRRGLVTAAEATICYRSAALVKSSFFI